MKKKNMKYIMLTFILIVLDQVIKLIVKNYYNMSKPLIKDLISFSPTLNSKYSYINSLLNLDMSKIFSTLLVVLILLVSYSIYMYYNYRYKENLFSNLFGVFFFSGAICSIIDKIFWNGSLDYIKIHGFFTFDMKDVYISIAEIIILIAALRNLKKLNDLDEKALRKDYYIFIKNQFKLKS
ncbi:signal peptidase II [Clostridium ihumii]|uniref:signal peptidase II n=1 Tax=Clostridium ihumii TaxID=1470356 RepID=UPI00058C9938|nr:signal peptidase II [Clostridium ihumii]